MTKDKVDKFFRLYHVIFTGRVLVTLAFPYRHDQLKISRPCSDTNHLVLASWEGADNYDALKSRIGHVYSILAEENQLQILLGGDLAFLCANFGCHPSMTQPCPWCMHAFDKTSTSEKRNVPFYPGPIQSTKKKATPRKDPIWQVDLANVSFKLC